MLHCIRVVVRVKDLALDLEEFGDVTVLDGGLLIQVFGAQRTGADQDLQTTDVRRGGVE